MNVVVLPATTAQQQAAWVSLLDLYDRKPTGWTLVGGQMVHLHRAERSATPTRPTDDVDTLLDVRAEPHALHDVTDALQDLGFRPDGTSSNGHQHRWVLGDATVDVLIPDHLGPRATSRRGVGGGTTIATPGAQQALDRTWSVQVQVGSRIGTVRRPSLLGALVAKGAAYGVQLDRARRRHLIDFAVLATLVQPGDNLAQSTHRDRHHLGRALGALAAAPDVVASVEGAAVGLARVRLALDEPGAAVVPRGVPPEFSSGRTRASRGGGR